MASSNDPKVAAILRDFEQALEDLTFNSKPLINDLTMAAEKYKPIAHRIVGKIEARLMEAHPNHILPSLYLMDSMMKNLGGEYLELFSKNIVALFCRSFEKLTDPKSRVSLYKLRQTWNRYIPTRKLAAIDKHVHALDPAWPVTATDTSLASPSIFLNPKFLGADQGSKEDTTTKDGPLKNVKAKDETAGTALSNAAPKRVSPPKSPSEPASLEGGAVAVVVTEEGLSVQEKRKQLLERKRQEKREQQMAMGLNTTTAAAKKEDTHNSHLSTKSLKGTLTPPAGRSISPRPKSSRTKARSVSPILKETPRSASPPYHVGVKKVDGVKTAGVNHVKGKGGVAALVGTKHELSVSQSDSVQKETPVEKRPRVEEPGKKQPEEDTLDASLDPIKSTHLQLDDVPPELLPKHHEYILKRVEKQLKTGNLSEEQHGVLVEQLERLYELQRQKDAGKGPEQQQQQKETRTDSSDQTRSQSAFNSKPSIPLTSHSVSNSGGSTATITSTSTTIARPHPQSTSTFGKPDVGVHHGLGPGPPPPFHHRRHHHHLHPPPPHPHPVHDRYPRRPRGGRRSHFRGRSPPPRGLERHFNRPLFERHRPPPPPWEPMDTDHSGPPPPPAKASGPPTQIHVASLFTKLVDFGIIAEGQEGSTDNLQHPPPSSQMKHPEPNGPPEHSYVPLNIPNLSFTVATLKQRYTTLISLLHAGEQCASCGLRFTSRSGTKYREHLDWHYRMNRKESGGKAKSSRNWFMHPDDWLNYEEVAAEGEEKELTIAVEPEEVTEQNEVKEEEPSSCEVLPGEGNEVCDICQEPFEQFWEEDLEEWHFKDAIRAGDSKLYHTFCYRDAKESGTLNHSGTQLPSPDEEHKPPD